MNETKIEVEYRPAKKIIIFEIIKLSMEDLLQRLRLLAMSGQSIALNWAEGIVFLALPFHIECDSVIEEAMKGNMYLSSVMYSTMEKYSPVQKIGGVEVPIVNQSSSPYLKAVSKKLKELPG